MIRCRLFLLLLAVSLLTQCQSPAPARVILTTPLGEIELEIFEKEAPISSANFLKYVAENRFQGAHFYRVVTPANQPNNDIKIEVIQGGLGFAENAQRLPAIPHETTSQTGLKHLDGTLSMARAKPGTAGSEFFICIGAQPELDFAGRRNPDGQGFAAFGQVVRGMEVVHKIQQLPETGQMLGKVVLIEAVKRVR